MEREDGGKVVFSPPTVMEDEESSGWKHPTLEARNRRTCFYSPSRKNFKHVG
jgi:hypothetical protein